MPNDTRPPADCHPDKPRKTADGRCDACYRRDRYQNYPQVRARQMASSAEWQEKTYGKRAPETCNDCGQTYRPTRRDEQHHTCQDCRNKNGGRPVIGIRRCDWCYAEFKYRYESTRFCTNPCAKQSLGEGRSEPIRWRQCERCHQWRTHRVKHDCPIPPPPPKRRPCATCGEDITAGRFYRYCSQHCSDVAYGKDRQAVYFIDCHWCGSVFASRQDAASYCSNPCRRSSEASRPRIGKRIRQAVYERDRWICQLCRRKVGKSFPPGHPRSASIDHIIPYSLGGTEEPANLQLAHQSCNSSKQAGVAGNGEQLLLLG